MKAFVFSATFHQNYHSDGGIVVVARDESTARAYAESYRDSHEGPGPVVSAEKLLATYNAPRQSQSILLFPNTGCC